MDSRFRNDANIDIVYWFIKSIALIYIYKGSSFVVRIKRVTSKLQVICPVKKGN